MVPTYTAELTQFNALLPRYAELSRGVMADVLNRKALYIARGAMERTKRASRAQIEKLGLVTKSVRQRTTSKGKIRNVRSFDFQTETAIANYAGALKRVGKSPRQFQDRAALAKAARRWIARKLTSIGFIASGWIRPIRKLQTLVPSSGFSTFTDARQYGKPKGYATAAKKSDANPFAIIANTATHNRYGEPIPQSVVDMMWKAVQGSISAEMVSTQSYIRRKMREAASQAGFKTS